MEKIVVTLKEGYTQEMKFIFYDYTSANEFIKLSLNNKLVTLDIDGNLKQFSADISIEMGCNDDK